MSDTSPTGAAPVGGATAAAATAESTDTAPTADAGAAESGGGAADRAANAPFEPFFFAQMADCQLGMQKQDKSWAAELEMARRAVDCVNRMSPPPKFATMCGDLINAFPMPDGSTAAVRARQTADLKDALKDLRKDVPFVCVCGNHDIGNTPTPATVAEWETTWGPHRRSFELHGCRMIVLNSQLFKDATHTKELAKEQVEWLKKELELSHPSSAAAGGGERSGNVHTILFSHIPPFVRDKDEAEQWCNWPEGPRKEVLDLVTQHGVRWWFCGHFHNNACVQYKDMELVITSASGSRIVEPEGWDYANGFRNGEMLELAIGDSESGFRLVHVGEAGLRHRFFTYSNMPTALTSGLFAAPPAAQAAPLTSVAQAGAAAGGAALPTVATAAQGTDGPPENKRTR